MFKLNVVYISILASSSAVAIEKPLDVLDLEDLLKVSVVSASKYEQSTEDAPASVTVITKDELNNRQYKNIAEALNTIPGVHLSSDHDYTYTGVRGLSSPGDYGTRILLLSDELRRNDPIFDQALFGNESPIDIHWLKQLEFVPGASSALYGANALLGTVNAVTYDGKDIKGTRLNVSRDAGGGYGIKALTGNNTDSVDWFIGASLVTDKGEDFYFPEYQTSPSHGEAKGIDKDTYQKVYAKIKTNNLTIIGNYSNRTKDIATAPYETSFNKKGTDNTDENGLFDIKYESSDASDIKTHLRFYRGFYKYEGNWNYSPDPNQRDNAHAEWFGTEAHLQYNGLENHKVLLGYDYQNNMVVEQKYYEPSSGTTTFYSDNPYTIHSLFLQDEWRLSKYVILNGALRQDIREGYDAELSPRLALILHPTEDLSLKASIGKAYRAPNAYEKYYNDGELTQIANEQLKPEHIISSELSATYNLTKQNQLGIRIFNNSITDFIQQTTLSSGLMQFNNESRVKVQGLELVTENTWLNGVRLRGSVSYQHGETEDHEELNDSPNLLGKVITTVPVTSYLTLSGEILGYSSRTSEKGDVPGYAVGNLSLYTKMDPKYGQLRLTINNITDKKYYDPSNQSMALTKVPQDERYINLNWAYNF